MLKTLRDREGEVFDKIYIFDLARGLASCLLVFHHYFFHCKPHGLFPAIAGTSIFYFISGFVMPMSLERSSIKSFLIKRFFRLYPTILFCLGILLFFTSFLKDERMIKGIPITLNNIFMNLVFLPHLNPNNNNVIHSYLFITTSWTICVDFTFYFLLILTYKFCKQPKRRINFIVILLYLLIFFTKILHHKFNIFGTMLAVLHFLLPYVFGMTLFYYEKGFIKKQHFIIISICLFTPLFFHNKLCKYVIGCLLMLYLFVYHRSVGNNSIVKFFAHISYPMFLMHSIVPMFIWHNATVCLSKNISGYYFFILYPAMIPVCYFVYKYIEKPCYDFGKKLAKNIDNKAKL